MFRVNKEKMEIEIGAGIEAAVESFLAELKKSINQMANSGMSLDQIKATLQNQLERGIGAPGELKKNLRTIVTAEVNEAANQGMYAEYQKAGVKKYRWVTVSEKPCPDCLERHGQVETWEDWELIGLPKSGFSVCQENCKCRLVPVNYESPEIEQAIIRKLQSPKGQAYAYYREIDVAEYVTKARETLPSAETIKRKTAKHPDFGGGEMTWSERVEWVRENPEGVYFRLYKGKPQVVFVRGDYYVFTEDGQFKTAYIPYPDKINEYREQRRYNWIKIPEEKWKQIVK